MRIVRLALKPEYCTAFRDFFDSRKEAIRAQPGCCSLALYEDIKYPGVFITVSHWQHEDALNAYRQSDLFANTWPAVKQWFSEPPQVISASPLIEL